MFDGFTRKQIKTQETTINLVRGGSGYPILLLHGYPQTHVCWHRMAPILAERFTSSVLTFVVMATVLNRQATLNTELIQSAQWRKTKLR